MIINKTGYLKKQCGFTLAEAMVAMVILGIAAAGVLLPFSNGAVVRAEGMRSTLGSMLAADLLEQIASTSFDEIQDSYGTYSEQQGHIISDFDTGAEFTDPMYVNFSRTARCDYVFVTQDSGILSPVFILITVEVNYNGMLIASANRLISQ